ncbi:hypothetical protein FRC00_002727 [Tulasnella sp. 408]|nr:hypothetical protein FRC00_002727 [Tulasnella sp. 408]
MPRNSPATANNHLSNIEPISKTAALKAKRQRERERKKSARDNTIGHEAERRIDFIKRSLQVAQEDFAVEDTIHSEQGYEGVRDGEADWRDTDPGLRRLDFLRDNRGYLVIDTTVQRDLDIPLVNVDGRIWAVILAEPAGWDVRRQGIQAARDRLDQQTAHLAVRPNRCGTFQSFNHGFSFGNGRTEPMNFANEPSVKAALIGFNEDEHVQAMFKYAETLTVLTFLLARCDSYLVP